MAASRAEAVRGLLPNPDVRAEEALVSQVLSLRVLLTWVQSRQRHLASLRPMETWQSRLPYQSEAQRETAKPSSVCG